MIYIENESNNPYFNLAFEEFCLGNLPTDDTYFILWRNAPAVIIGKNQDVFQEVDFSYAKEHGIYLVRRITGGGAVYHDLGNLNISIIGNYQLHPDYAEEYGRLITDALRGIGLEGVEMNGRNDLYVNGKKISGWAKRIQGDSFLLHGTLLYDVDLDQLERVLQVQTGKMQRKAVKSVRSVVQNIRELLPFENLSLLRSALEREMRGSDSVLRLNEDNLATINKMVNEKYATEEWIYSLSFKPTISKIFKTVCGTIIINVLLNNPVDSAVGSSADTVVTSMSFGGDFLGNKDTDELGKHFKGIVWNSASVEKAISEIDVDSYFTGLTNEKFLEMLNEMMC